MISAMRVETQPWMQDPEARRLLAAFAAAGFQARYVGGCVRDAVLGLPNRDIDIATDALPERSMSLIRDLGMTAVPTGIDHGTVTAVGHRHYEITTLRRDVSTDGRRASVAFTDDWREDAARRDFTMNAMFLDGDGAVLDFFGGLEDLAAGRVRFVGEAERRLAEDNLRLLRFFRFHAFFGKGAPDPAGLKACAAAAPRLVMLSVERIRQEMLRLLEAPDPLPCLTLMRDHGILVQALPEAEDAPDFRILSGIVAQDRAQGTGPDAILRLLSLLPGGSSPAAQLARRWKMSNADQTRMVDAAGLAALLPAALDDAAARRLVYRHGSQAARDAAVLHPGPTGELLGRIAQSWAVPDFPLQGRDLARLGMSQGPAIGRLLKDVEQWWIDGDFVADHDTCLNHLKTLIGKA